MILVLAVHPDYFRITGGLSRWLYRLMRKHAGNQAAGWAFTFRQLHAKSGSTQRFSDFARDICRIAADNKLPEYSIEMYAGEHGDDCLSAVRRTFLGPDARGYEPDLMRQVRKRPRTAPRLSA